MMPIAYELASDTYYGLGVVTIVASLSDLLAPLFLFWACGPLSVALGWVLDVEVSPCNGSGVS